ncbi:hypothetical protein J6590_102451 [Homalodisca vitripennis]|nr:hypothetical protein J6590_102451 [Homalodisca vitripennis]
MDFARAQPITVSKQVKDMVSIPPPLESCSAPHRWSESKRDDAASISSSGAGTFISMKLEPGTTLESIVIDWRYLSIYRIRLASA